MPFDELRRDPNEFLSIVPASCPASIEKPGIVGKINCDRVIDKLFGKNHWCTRWIKELCGHNTQFLIHLIEQTDDYIHILCLYRLKRLKHAGSAIDLAQFDANKLPRQSKIGVLKSVYCPYPKGLLGVTRKLGQKPLSKMDYRRLLSLLDEENARNYLTHTNKVSRQQLYRLEKLPPEFRAKKIIESIKKSEDFGNIQYIIEVLNTLNLDYSQKDIIQQIGKLDSSKKISEWFRKQLFKLDFPTPPWEGLPKIRPIRTVTELKSIGDAFKNCIVDYLPDILAGNKFLYVVDNNKAVFSLTKDPLIDWFVDELKGVKNKELSPSYKRKILDKLSEAGYQSYEPDSWWSILQGYWDN